MMSAATLVVVLTLAQVAPAMPGPPPAGAQTQKGHAVIKGRVTAADSGKPLRRAQITVTGQPLPTPKSTSTNARGEFEIKDLPAGRYQVRVRRGGYLPMQYGQRRSTETPSPLDIADGQVIEKLDFALSRAGIISGRVIDETGEPVANVQLFPMRQEYFRGRRRLVTAGSVATTDDTGQYRLLNMPPGEYSVMALLRETWTPRLGSGQAPRLGSGQAPRPGSGQAPRPGSGQGRVPQRLVFGYAPTYFPGVAKPTDAARVKVGVGQEVSSVDFALVAAPAGAISGTATGPDGAPLAGASVSLSIEITGPVGGAFMGVTSVDVGPDGSWRMPDIAPGEYVVQVSTRDRDRAPARARTTVFVQGDVEGVPLVADYGGTVTGQVVTDTGEALPASHDPLRVAAESVGPDGRPLMFVMGDINGIVGSDGRFTVTNVLGPSLIRVLSLPRRWAVKRVEGGEQDHAEVPVEVRGGRTLDVRVVITNQFPEITGRITDDKGIPVDGTVLLFPIDSDKWLDTAVLRTARPDQSGVFRIDSVRPGDYYAVAFETVESWQINDPEFLEGIQARGTRVTVREGQPQTLSLKVLR